MLLLRYGKRTVLIGSPRVEWLSKGADDGCGNPSAQVRLKRRVCSIVCHSVVPVTPTPHSVHVHIA